jgi:acyl-CoA reductase-like NAD-dependent aldehyde dehydrogenase
VWTPVNGREIAEELAARLSSIVPRASDDPLAELAPFVDRNVAARINDQIEAGLAEPGAEDVSARYRTGPRMVEMNGSTYLLPTIIHCSSASHPLANREFLFPYAAVVDVSADDMATFPDCLGPTLSLTALTGDRSVIDRLLGSDLIGRLNLGPIQTNTIAWDQPHEGNLFDHLYGRRAFLMAG